MTDSLRRATRPPRYKILDLWSKGMDTDQIARHFQIPESFVANTLSYVREKRSAKNRHSLSPKR